MNKWLKKIVGLAAASGAIAGLIYFFKKKNTDKDDEFAEDFEDDDFDLDSDLKPVSDREYVSLNPSAKDETDTEENSEKEAAEEASTEKEATEEASTETTASEETGEKETEKTIEE